MIIRSRWRRLMGAGLALALLAGACGDDGDTAGPVDGPPADEGDPVRGGSLVYALEAETSGGWCLPEAQLAIGGIQVARTIYDTLTMPDEDGEIQPYLAESVEGNETFDDWTIRLREGVTFHDGTPLTAEVVANNLNAYRGAYEGRSPLLFVFVFQNIAEVEAVDELTVRVTTSTPWPAFPWFLWGSSRIGIMAQAQLDDAEACDRNLIGTGPFVFQEWVENQRFVATRNEAYWATDADGEQLPYLDRIEYRPIAEGPQRINALEGGQVQAMHTSNAINIDQLRDFGDRIRLLESDAFGEVGYFMLNADEGRPFNDLNLRLAAAHAVDRERMNSIRGLGIPTIAQGPFGPGSMGHLEDSGYPEFDLERAEQLLAEAGGGPDIVMRHASDPNTTADADLLQEMLEDAGFNVQRPGGQEQAALINSALGGDFDVILWRNHPGGDPDLQYNWWATGSPVNFGRINDPDMQALLDRGRTETDLDARAGIYEDLTRLFAERVYNLWQSQTIWAIGTATEVRGIYGPDLPNGSGPFPGLGTGHPVSGVWLAQ